MAPKTKPEYQAAIRRLGEEPPQKWTMMELSVRLQELETEHGVETKSKTMKTDLQAKTQELNKASRKKADLVAYIQETLKIPIKASSTIKELQKEAMNHIYQNSELDESDPVGFGEHAEMSYGEILKKHPQYCQWVIQTNQEGDACMRLRRLAAWLNMDKPKTTYKEKSMGSQEKMNIQATTTTVAPDSAMVGQMVAAMQQMMNDMKDMKEEVENLRGRTHKKPAKEEGNA